MAYQMVIGAGTTLGAALAGLEADSFGLRAPFYIGSALLLVASLVSMRPRTPPRPVERRHQTSMRPDDAQEIHKRSDRRVTDEPNRNRVRPC